MPMHSKTIEISTMYISEITTMTSTKSQDNSTEIPTKSIPNKAL